jgi:hypothetical protein
VISGTFINYSKSFINEVKKLYYEIVIKFLFFLKKNREKWLLLPAEGSGNHEKTLS